MTLSTETAASTLAPTDAAEPTTPPTPDQQDGPPPEQQDDTPAWQRASTREEALAALLADEDLPGDALVQHPRVAGIIGTHARRQAQDIARQNDLQAREQRRRQLASQGLYSALGEEVAGEYTPPDPAAQLTNLTSGLMALQNSLPEEIRAKTMPEAYPSGGVSLDQWLQDIVRNLADHRLNEELPKAVEREIRKREPDLRKAWLAEQAGGEEAPEASGGRPASGRTWQNQREVEAAFLEGKASAADVKAARRSLPY